VINALIKDVRIVSYNKQMRYSAYIKTWVGVLVNQTNYENEYLPHGGGWYVFLAMLLLFFVLISAVGASSKTSASRISISKAHLAVP
jgi:hypothetical protein